MMFGIVQGGAHADLRRKRCDLVALDFPGYAIGGLAVGEPHEVTCEMAAQVTALLPAEKPRYVMGVGLPEQIADYVARGVDMMDCVLPTRNARNGCLFTRQAASTSGTPVSKGSASHRCPCYCMCAAAIRAPICATFSLQRNPRRNSNHPSQRHFLP